MIRKSTFVFLVLGFIALLSFPVLAQNAPDRPFKATVVGQIVSSMLVSTKPPTVLVVVTGSGQATHLGRYQFTFTHYIHILDGTLYGDLSMTAADGDVLLASVIGQSTPTAEKGVQTLNETATFSGGTGRFQDAAGSALITGEVDMNTKAVDATMEGIISY